MTQEKRVKVTLIKSTAKGTEKQKACVIGLGLRRLHHTVDVLDTPCNRGMIYKVAHLLRVEE